MNDTDIKWTLGNIQGTQERILDQLRRIEERFGDHINDDQMAFSGMRNIMSNQKDVLDKQFGEQTTQRNVRLDAQDKKLEEIRSEISFARGVGWVSIGIIGMGVAIIVGTIIQWIVSFIPKHG